MMLRPVVALSVAALVALAACSGPSGDATPPTPSSTTKVSQGAAAVTFKSPDAQPPAPPIPGAIKGGTLTVLSEFIGPTFDPTGAYFPDTNSILSGLVVRSLTQYMYDPEIKQMILVPDLATDLGRPSPDFKTWKFTLRPGVKFENGRPVTAQDLKYGIERSFDRATFPDGATYSNEYFLDGDTYQGPYKTPADYKGVTIDGNTITIKMVKPFPDMSYWGSFAAMSPIPPGKASDPATYQNHPWATGPYMFKDFTPGKSLVLVKNPYWNPNTDPGRHQYVNEFDFNFTADRAKTDQIILADTGTGQTTLSYNDVLADDYQEFITKASDRLVTGSAPCSHFWYPDNRKIGDINVRRALAYAYPYRAVWAAYGAIPGVTEHPATNVMPPGTPGRIAYNPLPGHTPWETDPAKAKELLTQVGKLGYRITWAYPMDNPAEVAGEKVIASALGAAGFDPQPVPTTSANYANYFNPHAEVNLRHSGWCSDWPTGSSWFPTLFQSTDIAKKGFGANYAAFSSKAVDDRINAIPRLLLTQQPAAWNALDRLIQTRYFPVIVTGYGGVAMMRGSKVHNALDDETIGMPTWKDIWLG